MGLKNIHPISPENQITAAKQKKDNCGKNPTLMLF